MTPPTPSSGLREEIIRVVFERPGRDYVDASFDELDAEIEDWITRLLPIIDREKKKAVEEALRPAENGGLHISVNVEGVTTLEHFRRVVVEIGNDLEIQKQVLLSEMFP